MEVTVTGSGNTRTYEFEKSINRSQFDWLKGNRNIEHYEVSGKSLTIRKSGSGSWQELENSFIMPGLRKAFGDLKVKQTA